MQSNTYEGGGDEPEIELGRLSRPRMKQRQLGGISGEPVAKPATAVAGAFFAGHGTHLKGGVSGGIGVRGRMTEPNNDDLLV